MGKLELFLKIFSNVGNLDAIFNHKLVLSPFLLNRVPERWPRRLRQLGYPPGQLQLQARPLVHVGDDLLGVLGPHLGVVEGVVDALGVGHPVAVDLLHRQQALGAGRDRRRRRGVRGRRITTLGFGSTYEYNLQ